MMLFRSKSSDYGKYETSNKLSYADFEKLEFKGDISFYKHIYPQMKALVRDSFRAVHGKMDKQKRINAFELFGYDFMIDEDYKVYLIEVNTNPCLETNCTLLSRIISSVIDNTFRVVLDSYFSTPSSIKDPKRRITL